MIIESIQGKIFKGAYRVSDHAVKRMINRVITLPPYKLIVLYKYISLQVAGVADQDKPSLNGAEVIVVEYAWPVGTKWLKRRDKLFAKSKVFTNNMDNNI
ncbi:MAG: hypothetical protein ACUZ8O_06080 [Candidatus Anammoxibacter sp.]